MIVYNLDLLDGSRIHLRKYVVKGILCFIMFWLFTRIVQERSICRGFWIVPLGYIRGGHNSFESEYYQSYMKIIVDIIRIQENIERIFRDYIAVI